MHETNEKDSGQTVINYGNVWKFLFYVVLVWSEAVWLMLTGMKTRWVRVMIRALQGERPGRKKEKTKQNTPQSYSVSSFRPLLWITSRDLSSYVLLKVNEKNCARTRVKFTLKAAFLGKRKKWQREGGKKKEKSHRECERITWTSTNIPFWLRVQIPCRYLSNDLCMFFIFLHGVIMKLQRLRTRACCSLHISGPIRKKETTENRDRVTATCSTAHAQKLLQCSREVWIQKCLFAHCLSLPVCMPAFCPTHPPTSYWDHYKWDWVCSPRLQIM